MNMTESSSRPNKLNYKDLPKMLNFGSLSPARQRTSSKSPTRQPRSPKAPTVTSAMLSGLKDFVGVSSDKQLSIQLVHCSVNSSITCTDFNDQELAGISAIHGPSHTMSRDTSFDSMPLRPYRRTSAEPDHQKVDNTKPKGKALDKAVACSVSSSITFTDFEDLSGLFRLGGDECTLKPTKMRRAVSVDSDSKPLRPYRRESDGSGNMRNDPYYPEPTRKASRSFDSQPVFPDRKGSMGLGMENRSDRSESSVGMVSVDSLPSAPSRKTSVTSTLASSSDNQPSLPGRKMSIFQKSVLTSTKEAPMEMSEEFSLLEE